MKKYLISLSICTTMLIANQSSDVEQIKSSTNPETNTQTTIDEDSIFEYQKVLQRIQEKKDYEFELQQEKKRMANESKIDIVVTVTLVGISKIGNKNTIYLLDRGNKIIKAKKNMVIDGFKIDSITSHGINISKESFTTFLPVLSNQIKELDVTHKSSNNTNRRVTGGR